MKTLRKVTIEPVFVEFIPEVLEESKLYISKKYGAVIHLCLCGCKEKTSTPLNSETFPTHGWDLIEKGDKVSLTPSIGNYQLPCKSHYIITNNVANFV